MKQPGRKSSAQLSVVNPAETVEVVQRPKPPKILTVEQANVWNQIVEALPADWFPQETHDLLCTYCRHVVTSRQVADLIHEYMLDDEFNLKVYDKLLAIQEREGRAISSLATRMRLTQQSTYDKEKSKGKGRSIEPPWGKK